MQTTTTTQVTSDISSEPVGKAEKLKKWKLVASGDTRENCTYPLDDPHQVTVRRLNCTHSSLATLGINNCTIIHGHPGRSHLYVEFSYTFWCWLGQGEKSSSVVVINFCIVLIFINLSTSVQAPSRTLGRRPQMHVSVRGERFMLSI